MPDLKQALRDFVATSNSGKYADEATLLSKFPELKGFDVQALRDFVATSNSGKYATEDEVFGKFPEFGFSGQPELKKKGTTELPSEDTSLDSSKPVPDYLRIGQDVAERGFNRPRLGGAVPGYEFRGIPEPQTAEVAGPLPKYLKQGQAAAETGFATPTGVTPLPESITNVIPEMAPPKKERLLKNLSTFEQDTDRNAYLDNIGTRALSGLTSLEKMAASLPETAINFLSAPQNFVAAVTGLNIAGDANSFKEQFGLSNPILDKLNEEEKKLKEITSKFNKQRYESEGIADNIQKGNYGDAFELLGSSIVESAPVSLAMMLGGATLTPVQLASIGTAAFFEQNREQLSEENPDMPEIEKTAKALGMSAAETVFSAIGTGTIGQVYKDIIKKEGVEVGKNIFRDGLVQAYKSALIKYGAPIGLLGEGIEESATQITQNVLSNKPTFEGVADAFITGAGSGVVFTAPINAMKARDKVNSIIETYRAKEDISAVLKDTDTKLDQVFNVSKDAPITAEQIQIANTNKSRDILSKNLAKKVKDGEISEDEAKQSLYVFDKVQQVSNAVKDLSVTNAEKAQIATLLRQRDQLKTDIQNQDDVLVVREKQEIADINNQIQQIIMESKPQAEAVQIGIPEEITSLDDNESVTFNVKTIEEIPEQFRDIAVKKEGIEFEGRKMIFGLPLGKKVSGKLGEGYSYTLTGKQVKDYAIQEQAASQVLVQPTTGVSQEVAQGEPQAGPQVVTTGTKETITPEGTQEVVELDIDDSKPYKFKQIKAPIKGDSITIGGNVVGGIEYSPGLDGDAEINFIEINPEYKNKGYANTIIDNIIQGSENKKVIGIATKESAPFWKKIGAEFIGEADKDGNIDFVLTKENFKKYKEVSLKTQPTTQIESNEQPTTGVSQEVAQGEPQAGPQVVTAGAQEVTPEGGTQEVVKTKSELFFNDADVLFPNDDIRGGYAVTDENGTQIGRVKMSEIDDNVVKIDEVVSEKRGQRTGNGSAIMKMVIDNADKNNVTLTLTPNLIGGLKAKGFETPKKLEKFYEKFGFVKDAGSATMTRTPAPQAVVPEVSLKTQPIEEITQQIKELEKEKLSLTSKALKQFPNSPIQLKTRARIDEINSELKTLKAQQNAEPTTKPTGGPVSGNRLFNKPIKAVSEIANRYYQRIFGTERPKYFGSRGLDEARAKRLAQAFIDMQHNPNDPEVKAAYEAMAKETIEQYKEFLDAGYTVEINNEEPYANSQDMIDDLRNNKRIKIFSTESGFGDVAITPKQRKENPLLAKSKFKDVNGKPLLINDLFRAVHDFFGHAELGNSFGPKGEENAWNVHARMFSSLARRAMTTETRGQNAFVNFSGVNEKIEKDRDEARKLREAGDVEGAKKLVDKIYEEGSFAEQKIGLLPEEFSQFDEQDMGDVSMRPEGLQERDMVAEPVQAEPTLVIEEEQFVPITLSEIKTDAFTKDNAIDYIEDEKETESGRTVTYISSLTVEARNADGDPIGTITKLTDEDKIFSFTATDIDGNEINLDGYETLGEAKQALADKNNKIQKKEFDKEQKKKAKEKAKVAAKKAKAKTKAEPTVEEQVTGALDDLLALDPNDKTTLEKISNGLDKVIKDINKFEKENLGVNIALPIMKTILKAIKVLVDAGVALQDAIKRVAKDNNVNSRDVIDGINAISQIAPIQAQYDTLMTKADELIARQKSRGIADAKIVSNLDTFIRNSEVYKNANDAQKKIMEREARTKMGVGPKRAVSIGRVLGALKDITNITREEKMLVIKQIRDLSRDAAKELAKDIREMASKGKITSIQAANIVSRFSKVNMLNEISVSNFVDYMAKVFANAEYADKIDVAKSKLKMAKKNILTKIGTADGLVGPLNRLFSINPTLIPNEFLGRYLELVDMFGARQAVLTLDEKSTVTKDVEAILNEIDNEQSKADELADRFNASENKVYKDDELDYAASVKKMLDEKEIDEKEAETMRKYKEDIAPQVEETELTEDEAEAEKKELIDSIKKSEVNGLELSTKYQRDKAKALANLIKTDAINSLTNTELKNLLKVINNINNNYFPHYAQLMVEKLNSINNGVIGAKAIERSKVAKFSNLYSRAKAWVARTGRTGISEMIRRNPLYYIDQLFGDFKTKDIFNSVLNKAAEGQAQFKAELKKVQNILEKAEEKISKSFKLDPNKTLMSKFKMMTYMIQLEFESNKGNKEVNPAAQYLKATVKHIDEGKSQFGERDAEMLQEILNNYTDANGNIDNEKLYNSFNQAEKDAIKDIRGVNESLREKAEDTAAIIRGDRITPLNNYVHLNVLHEHQPNDLTNGTAFVNEYNDSMRPSTKAKSLIARTGKVSPLNFDVFASAQRGAKFVLMDYNLTEPIRTARKTINQMTANLEKNGRIPKEKRQILNAINSALEETIDNLLTNSYISNSIVDDAIDYINKQGYRAILAGTGRFISELSSNIGFAMIADPKAFIEGAKYKSVIMSESAPLVMENVNSKQTNRIFPTDTLSGKLIDTSILSQASGIKGGKSNTAVANKIQQIYNLSGKKYVNAVELTADALISTPDKIIMRPMWFGSFANQFKNITGKDVDFEKIASNDEKYMTENKDAIEKSKTLADERSVMAGATDNAFMGILKGTTKPNQSLLLRGFNNFNNFMTRFLIFEYVTARTAVNAAIGNGSLTKKQGGALLGAVATRMIVYTLLTQMLGSGLIGLIFGGDDEPETEKSFLQKFGQSIVSGLTSLLIGRDFGNATKGLLNYGVERANEKYLDFLREGDYDPYKDAIQYTIVPPERKGRQTDLFDYGINMLGSFGPSAKTLDLIVRKLSEPEKKEAAAIERQKKELNVRIPLEVLGNMGLVPLYKDIRKAVMKDMYKDLEKAKSNNDNKAQLKVEKLQGFDNEEDMKRYDYDLWYRTFGPDAPDFDAKQAEKLLKREKDSVERAMKDEMYDYTPKPKKGKGGLQKLY